MVEGSMMISRRSLFVGLAGAVIASQARADDLGVEWFVHEETPDGQAWEGVWRRRGFSNVFDARWRNVGTGGIVRDVVEIQGRNGNSITIYRYGNNGTYFGSLSPSGRHIRGSASWYPPGAFWTARIGY
jgi:hypothetical protein